MRITSILRSAGVLILTSGALLGCSKERTSSTTAIYALPTSLDALSQETFFDHPWPSDLRLENGSPRFDGYYNPRGFAILDTYVGSVKGVLDGFSPAASGFVRFTGPIDPESLPKTPRDTLDTAASVQLIDIDPKSPEHGQRKLISLRWQEAEGVYYRANTLSFMPTIGFPLRPHTRYAFVVTDALQAKSGGAIAQQADLGKVVGASDFDGATRAAHTTLAPMVQEIEKAGVGKANIVHLAVFTTDDPTEELTKVRDAVTTLVPAPTAESEKWKQVSHDFYGDEYQGRYGPSPNFQAGTLPFAKDGDGGAFVFQNGKPVLQDTFDLRFSILVPSASQCPMPQNGYPIVLYAHGTGGNWRSYLNDSTGRRLAEHCIATMGVDQIFHGDRPGAPSDGNENTISILFFNFQNPTAARTNGRQSAIDEVQRARLFTESHMTIPASIAQGGKEVRFDASQLMFFGHSQGGLNGPLFTAVDPSARGAVFSGSGAQIAIALLEKTQPEPSPAALVRTLLLGLKEDEGAELDEFHPVMSLAQTIVDAVDPLHYARMQSTEPRSGFAAKSVYMTEGINPDGTGDSYAPPHGIEAHAVAMGLPLQLPDQRAIAELAFGGVQPLTIPAGGLAGNLASGKASGVLAQWAVPPGTDGHFVIFDVPQAQQQAMRFLQNLTKDPNGLVPPP
ncbi:Putative extracellular enzyme of alpha/beta hydrolase superfamily protein [Minicystis rosea]|nr:Putative extracellular enzyme of alpha/beta hydrolase superfamily protein [Minicystis rosea]